MMTRSMASQVALVTSGMTKSLTSQGVIALVTMGDFGDTIPLQRIQNWLNPPVLVDRLLRD